MPELPETETIARDLDAALRGASVYAFRVARPDIVRGGPMNFEGPRFTMHPITRVFRRAKAIVLEFSSGARIVVVPRFTGALLIGGEPQGDNAGTSGGRYARISADFAPMHPYGCVQFVFTDGRHLQYVDVRRLGTLELMSPERYAAWDASLGPEPLDPELSAERFSGILRGSRRAVKTVLMDQKRLAGVGNIYANEALWHAGIRPARRAQSVTRAEAARLLEALRTVLNRSIELRGTTFRDFQDAYGGRGGYARELKVYGRGGEPCLRCGAVLAETHALEGRSTVWCRACQR